MADTIFLQEWEKAKLEFEKITGKSKPKPNGKIAKAFNHSGLTGDLKTAERLDRQVKRYRDRNPYYLYWTARNEAAAGQLEEARRHLRRAIRLKDDEPEFHEFMSEIRSRMAAAPAPDAQVGGAVSVSREKLLAVR